MNGNVVALEKSSNELLRSVPPVMYLDLKEDFYESGEACLASEHAYRLAFRGAVLEVGGHSTGTPDSIFHEQMASV